MKIRNFVLAISVAALELAAAGCSVRKDAKHYADYSTGSGFEVVAADSVSVENLVVLGKVWGFAKYHHPAFADSHLNVDYELFELLPQVAYVSRDELGAMLLGWVQGLGEFKSAEERYRREIETNHYTLTADLAWLDDVAMLGEELSAILRRLRYAERSKPSRYAKMIHARYINFDAESSKGPASTADTGYGLLTLFRLWNMAEYYFPSVGMTNKKWPDVLVEYVAKYLNTTDQKWTTAELVAELSDTHAGMSPNHLYTDQMMPVELGFVEGKLIVTAPRKYLGEGEESLFEAGDEIIAIEGHTPDYFVEHTRKYISASNENVLLRDAARLACWSVGEKPLVEIRRRSRRMKIVATPFPGEEYRQRWDRWQKSKNYFERLNSTVGYLNAARFSNSDGALIMDKFKDCKAIIVDMRCYPSDFMPFDFIGRFFVPNAVQHVTFTTAVAELPGYFKKDPASLGVKNDEYYKGQVVVLVNEQTQSQAEYTAMAFQATPNCIVVGSQTAGADGNVVAMPLPGGVQTLFSGLGVFYPDGTNTQQVGVRIDHYITPTIEGIRTGRDEVLERALEIIAEK